MDHWCVMITSVLFTQFLMKAGRMYCINEPLQISAVGWYPGTLVKNEFIMKFSYCWTIIEKTIK